LGNPASSYRAVLLDVLGTLVELEPPWPHLRRILRDRHGIEVSQEEAKEAMLAEMAYYRRHHIEGRDAASLAELRRRCAAVLHDCLPGTDRLTTDELTEALLDSLRFVPYPDAAPTLARLRVAGLRLAVVSNWDCSLGNVLAGLGLAGALDAVIVSATAGAAKPDERIFRAALEAVRCESQDAVFVGDSPDVDVEGAQAAGLRAVLLDRHRLASDGPWERIFSLAELPELVTAGA
jgi:HAD superfamily hydrolase (TIGR01509 family)